MGQLMINNVARGSLTAETTRTMAHHHLQNAILICLGVLVTQAASMDLISQHTYYKHPHTGRNWPCTPFPAQGCQSPPSACRT